MMRMVTHQSSNLEVGIHLQSNLVNLFIALGQKINILSIKNFWAQISQLFSGKDILTLNEVEEAIFQLCGMDEKICQTFINHLSGFIPIDIRGDFVFGEEEFVALIQRCTDDVIINFFV